jgi:beta-xylosidase
VRPYRDRIRLLVVLLMAVAVAGCGSGGGSSAVPKPVLDQDFPDPDVLHVDGTYYAYATQRKDGSSNAQLATSTDLKTWEVAEQDPLPKLPDWATTGRTWAPDVAAVDDGYLMYLTAWDLESARQCIGVARSDSPMGRFTPVGTDPLICPTRRGGAIDAATFVERDGTRYLLWKNDGNCCGKPTWIHLQRMSTDGLRTTGRASRLIRQDRAWEGELVEAPTLVRRGSSYVLFYSANSYGDGSYATGYAVAERLRGPYVKADRPLLTTATTGITGPGGQDVVADPSGKTYLVFHGWDKARIYRGMYVAELNWRATVPTLTPLVKARPSAVQNRHS